MFNKLILAFIGASSGGIIAAGIFAFLAMIGIFPRLIGKTNTGYHIALYETMIILGGLTGNFIYLYPISIGVGGKTVLAVFGFSVGIFIGTLVMSLAETLKAVPVFSRRINLAVGIQYVILAYGIGKTLGSLLYFAKDMGV
ncbi:MAG: stage V sporulation protein AB [Lachnospiraceae bacterium]